MHVTPDDIIFWQYGFIKFNMTLWMTWLLMFTLTGVSFLISRHLSTETKISRWQNLLEIIVIFIKNQLFSTGLTKPKKYIDFLGTLFVFIGFATFCGVIPGYRPPTGSLSTTAALATCVFFAVPIYGIAEKGVIGYLKRYVRPTVFMLPFNILGDLSRTLALAVRLFGNAMSGTLVIIIVLSIAPLVLPIFMQVLGLLSGLVQAYIFGLLATVYIAAAVRTQEE